MPLTRPGRGRAQRPRLKLNLMQGRALMLVVIVAAAAYGVSRMFAINQVVVSSPSRGEEIRAEAQQLVAASWQQGNLITLNTDDLALKLQQADPLLRSVEVKRKWAH